MVLYRMQRVTGYFWGNASNSATISLYAWYHLDSPNGTHPVATKPPNAWGLYDMSGNVWQWCNDWYASYTAELINKSNRTRKRQLPFGTWGML